MCDDLLLTVLSHSPVVSVSYYGRGSGAIWLDDVQCTGHEKSIFECRANTIGIHNCAHYGDIGIMCPSKLR